MFAMRVTAKKAADFRLLAGVIALNLLLLWPPTLVYGQWQQEGEGRPICIDPTAQKSCLMAEDSAGGAYIVWQDSRLGNVDIWVQHLDELGYEFMETGGISVLISDIDEAEPTIMNDGLGGLLVVWRDRRNGPGGDLYGQRFSPNGQRMWESGGKELVRASNSQCDPVIAPGGEGYFFLGWRDYRANQDTCDIRLQKFNLAGERHWTTDFVVTPDYLIREAPCLVGDGQGSAYLAWCEKDKIGATQLWGGRGVYLFKVGSDGVPAWTPDRLNLILSPSETELSTIEKLRLISGGEQEVWLNWVQNWVTDVSVLAHVTAAGELPGYAPFDNLEHVWRNHIAGGADGHGWLLTTELNGWDLLLLRKLAPVFADGEVEFSLALADGRPIDDFLVDLCQLALISLPDSGAVAIWNGYREAEKKVCLAQKVSADGQMEWEEGGLPLVQGEVDHLEAVTDGGMGVIVAYVKTGGIFTKKILDGALVNVATSCRPAPVQPRFGELLINYPNPFNARTKLVFNLAQSCDVEIDLYDFRGRLVQHLALGRYSPGLHSTDLDGSFLASGIYFCRLTAGDGLKVSKMLVVR